MAYDDLDQGSAQFLQGRLDPEARLWAAFATATTNDALSRSWLALQCRTLGGVESAVLLLAKPGKPFAPVAVWPDAGQGFDHLRTAAEQCLQTGHPVVLPPPHESGAAGLHIAYPFLADGDRPIGVVVLDLHPLSPDATQKVLRSLHWGVGWLEAQAVRERMAGERSRIKLATAALDIVAVANEHDRLEASALAVVNELAARTGASRVALGLRSPRGARLLALSKTAWFKRGATLVRAVEAAMDEAMDQRVCVTLPALPETPVRIDVAHDALRQAWDQDGAFATFPLVADGRSLGAITVVRAAEGRKNGALPVDEDTLRLGEAVTALLAPILESKQRARRWFSGRAIDSARDAIGALAGPRYLGWKFIGTAAVVAAGVAIFTPTSFRVSGKAILEGRVQLVAPAPFDGFVATAPARAGDIVHKGDVLATLTDDDLQLDRLRWTSERERLVLKSREAMAKHDRATDGQLGAQMHQTSAQLELTEDKLARTRILAPIDGVIVSGDLSQMLGAPVETGKVLYEIAPLDDYRVVLRLDERDLRYVHPGERGQMLLHGLSGRALKFTVTAVTSVAEVDNGRNTFRVEAMLDGEAPDTLRPGMEGIGKVVVGRHSYAWVWTRGLMDWARMFIWTWTP